jgi:uncharacterized protein YcsI (UPF0317 family)
MPRRAHPPVLPTLPLAGDASPAREARSMIRSGNYAGPTAQLAPDFLQANLVVVERRFAFDFLMFTLSNPKPCEFLFHNVGSLSIN